jgi:DNA polymerase III psi subunit
MSLDNIQLSGIALQELYKKTLVEVSQKKTGEKKSASALLNILGKNLKNIILIVRNNESAFLTDDDLNFLLGILSACKLNMDDVAVLNLAKNKNAEYETIAKELNAEKVFLFGVDPGDINLPLAFPHYQAQQFKNQLYLSAPSLSDLQHDKTEKTKLWTCLKKIFSI